MFFFFSPSGEKAHDIFFELSSVRARVYPVNNSFCFRAKSYNRIGTGPSDYDFFRNVFRNDYREKLKTLFGGRRRYGPVVSNVHEGVGCVRAVRQSEIINEFWKKKENVKKVTGAKKKLYIYIYVRNKNRKLRQSFKTVTFCTDLRL